MKISEATVARLVLYHRLLERLHHEGQKVVSSQELGDMLGLKASQVRKDLSYFGEIGKRGVGYLVGRLYEHLEEILSQPGKWKMALVGVGHLGSALLGYKSFYTKKYAFDVIFDRDPDKVGKILSGIPCHHIDEACKVLEERGIEVAVLAVPPEAAQVSVDKLISCSRLRGILNFSPASLIVPDSILVYNVDISVELEKLLFYMKQSKDKK